MPDDLSYYTDLPDSALSALIADVKEFRDREIGQYAVLRTKRERVRGNPGEELPILLEMRQEMEEIVSLHDMLLYFVHQQMVQNGDVEE